MNTQSEQHINASFLGNETESFLNSRLEGAKVQVVDDKTLLVDVTNPLCVTYTPQSEDDLFDRRFQDAYLQIVEAMEAITPVAPDFITIRSPHKQFVAYDPDELLKTDEIELLEKVDLFNYPLLRYANLAALHREVIVVISKEGLEMSDKVETMTYDELVDTIVRLEAEIERLEAEHPIDYEMRLAYLRKMLGIYKKAKDEADIEGKSGNDPVTVTFPSSGGNLGEYVRCNPGDVPIVYLYYNNIQLYYHNSLTNFTTFKQLLACVYVHEMMHAYYDTDKSLPSSQHYIPCLEEPLAELGALRFMKAFDGTIYKANLRDVEQKKYSPSICFYGFGAYLSDVLQDTTLPELMCRQPKPINGIAVSEYEKIWKTHIYPFNSEAETAEKMFEVFGCAYKTTARRLSDKWFILSDDGKKLIATIPYKYKHLPYIAPHKILYVPNGVEEILSGAFGRDYVFVDELVLPDTVTTIGKNAFSALPNLQRVTLPKSLKSIGGEAFSGCTGLTSVKIPNGTISIGAKAFEGCTNLKQISIPDSVAIIERGAFIGCTQLTSIEIPDSITTIESDTFFACTSLISITIPKNLSNIGDNAFKGCIKLQSIKLSDSIMDIGNGAFMRCYALNSVTIPNGVKKIKKEAFKECKNLCEITIPDSVTEIEGSAFEGCTNINSIIIPTSIKKIGAYAFKDCKNLFITIPNSIQEIGDYAFEGCANYQIPKFVKKCGQGINKNFVHDKSGRTATFYGTSLYEATPDFVLDFEELDNTLQQDFLEQISCDQNIAKITIIHYVDNKFLSDFEKLKHQAIKVDIYPSSNLRLKNLCDLYHYSQDCKNNKIKCLIEYANSPWGLSPQTIKEIIVDRPLTTTDIGYWGLHQISDVTLTVNALKMLKTLNFYQKHIILNINEDIPTNAFEDCKWLNIKIGPNVTIHESAFRNCMFETIQFDNTPPILQGTAFVNCRISSTTSKNTMRLNSINQLEPIKPSHV